MDLKELTNLFSLLHRYKEQELKCHLKIGGKRCCQCFHGTYHFGGCGIRYMLEDIQDRRKKLLAKRK